MFSWNLQIARSANRAAAGASLLKNPDDSEQSRTHR
jgi:hypothetical protein